MNFLLVGREILIHFDLLHCISGNGVEFTYFGWRGYERLVRYVSDAVLKSIPLLV